MNQESLKLNCSSHEGQKLIFICLASGCSQENRIGCQKCLLGNHAKCIKGCIFLNELEKLPLNHSFAWSGNVEDIEIEKFIQNKASGDLEIEQTINDLQNFIKDELKKTKKEVMQKKIQGKGKIQKEAKNYINQFRFVYSLSGLKQVVKDFLDEKITEAQVTEKINSLSTIRIKLEEESQKGKICTNLPTLLKEDIVSKQGEIIDILTNIENFVRFQNNWVFTKSVLSKNTHSAQGIQELTSGIEFQFNEIDNWQLIYGNQRMKDGKHQWEIQLNLVDQVEENKQDEQKKENTEQEGFESLFSDQQSNNQNTGIFAQPEYKYLNRVYIGIVQETKKDITTVFIPGSGQCEGVDIIRGQLFGNMYMQGGMSQQFQNVFNTKKKEGITVVCNLDIETKRFEVREKSGATAYECVYYTQGVIEWRPFILSVRSKIKAKLIV